MTINLKPETERLVQQELQNGHFRPVDEMIVEGVQARREEDPSPQPTARHLLRRSRISVNYAGATACQPARPLRPHQRRPGLTAFVLDNSVTMRWCFENTSTHYSEDALEQFLAGRQALVPVLWLY